MADIMQYVHALADEIGPRPATTDSEHRAASYLESVFSARGLEPEVQEFDAIRTYAWAYVLYNALTILSAWAAGFKPFLVWPAFAIAALTAFFMWTDLDTRWGFTRLMPKGPSQNVIARHVPKTRRGDRLRKIVIVAHYDSARSSLAFSPGTVKGFPVTLLLTKVCTIAVPVLIFAMGLPLTAKLAPWLWYATMVVSAYLLVPLFVNVHRELGMPFVDGANDNASGVAAMLGVMDRIVPDTDMTTFATSTFAPVRRDEDAALAAGVVPEGAQLRYSPASTESPLPADFEWAEPEQAAPAAPVKASTDQGFLDFETIEFLAVDEGAAPQPSAARFPEPEAEEPAAEQLSMQASAGAAPERKRGFLGGLGKGRKREPQHAPHESAGDMKGWLGVDEEFDARKAGRDIGSWDNFGDEPGADDDGFGWKGGWAGEDPIENDDFAASEAARIRRKVTETVDRELSDKEVWFVATGAEEVGTLGMQAFLRDHADDLRDAMIINIDNVGAGELYWITAEGMARRYRSDRRLVSLVKRVSRENEIRIKPHVFKGMSTDATPALARGFKAMSIMALDAQGLPPNWHWRSDVADEVDPQLLEKVVDLVASMIRSA